MLGNRSIELLILLIGQAMAHPLEHGNKSCSFLGRARRVELGKQSTEELIPFIGQAMAHLLESGDKSRRARVIKRHQRGSGFGRTSGGRRFGVRACLRQALTHLLF
jgi:hypothetical protein